MMEIVAIVVILWLLGVIAIPWLTLPHLTILSVLGYTFTLQRLLILGLLIWLSLSAGAPFRQMFWVFVILWLLTTFGIIVVGGMPTLIVIAIVVGLILSLIQK